MSLNDLILQQPLLERLYPEGLVPLFAPPAPSEPEALPPMLGGGGGGILIAVHDGAHPFLGEAALAFLTSVLGACRRSLADIHLCNLARAEGWTGPRLAQQLQPRWVLLFGLPEGAWPLPGATHYTVLRQEGCAYLPAPPLPFIESDKGEKAKLWNSLKTLFSL